MFRDISPLGIEGLIRTAFLFLETEHEFHVHDSFADVTLVMVDYASALSLIVVSWDLLEDLALVAAYPLDDGTVDTDRRVTLGGMVAIGGGSVHEIVHAPDIVDVASATETLARLASLLRKYGDPVLTGEWGDTVERLRAWDASGAWKQWRDG